MTPPSPPAIVVVAYNRPLPLKRLLASLSCSVYPNNLEVPLVVSVDKSENISENRTVIDLARAFEWKHGPKTIIEHDHRLGLRNHILSCGDLVERFDAVIVLEDDLFVSPVFYMYACQAMRHYLAEPKVCGISLYSYYWNEYARLPFTPIADSYDGYFAQIPSSWGQLWTRTQWSGFRSWYNLNSATPPTTADELPRAVIAWRETSWKKYFARYMVVNDLYFVYPRVSVSTNFGDAGTHLRRQSHNFQVPLAISSGEWRLADFQSSLAKYDSYFELRPESLKILNPDLRDLDFAVDLYGLKETGRVTSESLLSIKPCKSPVLAFSLQMLPHEMNVVMGIEGTYFSLGRRDAFDEGVDWRKRVSQMRTLQQDYGTRVYAEIVLDTVLTRVRCSRVFGRLH